ncbi:protein serine/threonine kinase, putative [Entamoeba invadens IP1]|uniref:Protein serine/threonine kinase, putative n=1 Tax=Entamoeba invadens IP1 TaxID=370355 RepID=A0A0A1TWF4_ENTIV|nr:protein serine/threonine kinase, putative [Entamoeba invadens IP1]ELP85490.1 protein serine/threonine kinase, putative [Entamoeba invadens IP1]|eukprot:XP_004184836.1 protein serine/threonine kinase, putative [Entamoeba invadens IP1]
MEKMNDVLCSNKNVLRFDIDSDEVIKVNTETRDLICIGNTSKHSLKVQFSVIEGCDCYQIRTLPSIVTLKQGKACEFELFIKPLCSCQIKENIMAIALDIVTGTVLSNKLQIEVNTEQSTKLNYRELEETKQIGEGSFGVVYKGNYRGNVVAIKKMKQSDNKEETISEFKNEVDMLDKFRSEYIVHFFGAVLIPNKICMVTEFAQYGNIKPDNILVISLDMNDKVNAKLTDFGSARNINMLMTNMSFTKGIGTPVDMAPEIVKKEKYKKSADVFSLGITMFECFGWCQAYPKTQFKYPWVIAKFVIEGKRLDKKENMSDKSFEIIQRCWEHEQSKRLNIKDLISSLSNLTLKV